jgi:DNA (cytosine-5)-methyltransferase 1
VKRLKVLSLYTGIGGLDLGFEAAGFETAVALDLDPAACRLLRLNRDWPVLEGDIANITSDIILRTASIKAGNVDVLVGGPPCQPFSKSAYWATGDAKRLGDPRAGTLGQYLRVLRDTLPRTFLLENVLGLAYAGKSEGLDFIRRGVARINAEAGTNYAISVQALNAADYGVPQLRERVFIVGSRDGAVFRFPKPTHHPPDRIEVRAGTKPYSTAWDALGDLPENPRDPSLAMTGKWAELLATIPEGQNYLWHTQRGGGLPLFGWRTRFWNFLLKLSKAQPSWTLQAQPGPSTGPFHWRNRKLSALELARLQTFPNGLVFDCERGEAQRLIGNAVPSALAECLAREIKRQLLGLPLSPKRVTLLPPDRGAPPAPERIRPVLAKYQSLAGEHAAHPGTGKGRRATLRVKAAA